MSLICSDHPQTYSLPIRLFGRSRLPEPGQPGISIFDIQARIGHSSPEIHAFFPRNLTIRQTIENAWADTFLGKPLMTYERDIRVEACLRWFQPELDSSYNSVVEVDYDKSTDEGSIDSESKKEQPISKLDFTTGDYTSRSLDWADNVQFGDAPFTAQRVALFLRAFIKQPDLLILDEAFSGMDDWVRDKCLLFLAHGESKLWFWISLKRNRNRTYKRLRTSQIAQRGQAVVGGLQKEQAMVCISHVPEEVSGMVREWLCLPEADEGKAARFGRLKGPLERQNALWEEIWGM